jgi:capsular polysaccharide biosynthesis protein
MKRVILHIGTGKTGTSSIQNYLLANRPVLMAEHDVDFLEFGLERVTQADEVITAHYPLAYWLSECREKQARELVSHIENSPCGTVLLSCENFYHLLFEQQLAFLAEHLRPFSVEVLCYVRRQDQYIESAWKQQVKVGEFKMPFAEFMRRHTDPAAIQSAHANYHRMLLRWAEVFGPEAVHLRVFDPSEFASGDLLDDFLQACGVDPLAGSSALERPSASNLAIPSELIELLRVANAMKLVEKSDQELFFRFLRGAGEFANPSLMTRADRLAVVGTYRASNERLFAELAHRDVPACFTGRAAADADPSPASGVRRPVLSPPEQIALRTLHSIWKSTPTAASLPAPTPAPAPVSGATSAPVARTSPPKVVPDPTVLSDLRGRGRRLLGQIAGIGRRKPLADATAALDGLGLLATEAEIDFSRHLALERAAPRGGHPLSTCGPFELHAFDAPFATKIKPLQEIPLKFMAISDAVLTASRLDSETRGIHGGIYAADGHLIAGATYRGAAVYRTADTAALAPVRAARALRIDGPCVYLGWWPDHFGHFLIEATARLWAARETAAYRPTFVMHPLNANVSLETLRRKRHVRLIFEAFGVSEGNLVLAQRDLRCEHLLVPTSQMALGMYIGRRQSEIFDRIADHACGPDRPRHGTRRIYLSREALSDTTRKAKNEAQIAAYFASAGFEIVHPERLQFDEQIRLMGSAAVIAGCDGSALHMGLFMPEGGMVICLSARDISRNQLLVGSVRQLRTHIINAKHGNEPLPDWRSPWTADLSVIRMHVDRLLRN